MQIRELSQPITAKALNESLAKKFGYKLNLEQFTDVQLEDARNKLRTKISQFELEESFDSVHESAPYQKTRTMLDIVNQELSERAEQVCDVCHKHECECSEEEEKPAAKKEKKTDESYMSSTIRQRATAHSIPTSWINSAINRIELGESDKDELKAELYTRYDLNETMASYILAEGEEDKAKIIMATKDMVDRITGWLEDTAQMKAEKLLELLDSIRAQLGSDVASKYEQSVKPALEQIYSALEQSRQGLSSGLATVSGGEQPMMGAGSDMGMEEPMPGAEPEMGGEEPTVPAGAPLGASATPPATEANREKRESVDYSRRLGILLASKKN